MNALPQMSSAEFERWRLMSGRLVGDEFQLLPGISAFGAVLRTSRLNAFVRSQFFSAYGIRLIGRDDVSRVLTFSSKRKAQLARAMGISDTERRAWNIQWWLPFTGDLDWSCIPWRLRVCTCCARVGYHSLLFQLPWINRCPWHRCKLITHCERCSRPMGEALTEGFLLQCPCGRDYFNAEDACQWKVAHLTKMRPYIDVYCDWASVQRPRQQLVCANRPEASTWEALQSVVDLPAELATGRTWVAQTTHRRQIEFRRTVDGGRTIAAMATELRVSADGATNLPTPLASHCRAAARNMVTKLPNASLTDGEWRGFAVGLDRPDIVGAGANRSSRVELLFLPVQSIGTRAILDVSSVAKAVRDVIQRAARFICPSREDRQWETKVVDDDGSVALLAVLVQNLLLRAYAEGLRVILARYIDAIFKLKRDRPHLTTPLVLIEHDLVGAYAATLVWTRADPVSHDALSRRTH